MDKFSFLNAAHTAYFADLYEQYLQNPDTVEPSWRAFFQGYDFGSENYGLDGEIIEGVSTQIPEQVQKQFALINLWLNRVLLQMLFGFQLTLLLVL